MKTIAELNSTWWYRLLKVFYILLLLVTLAVSITLILDELAPYMTTDMSSSTVKCTSGNMETFSFNQVAILSSYNLSIETTLPLPAVAELCDLRAENGDRLAEYNLMSIFRQDKQAHQEITDFIRNSYKVTHKEKQVGSWFEVVKVSTLSLVGILIFFETIKRVFYYILLGSIRPPKKKHESDTVLP